MYIDSLYFYLVLPAIIFAFWAQINVTSTFKKYSQNEVSSRLSGFEAARMILDGNGLYNVSVERVQGKLTDHYDPRANVIRLSESVYDSKSPAAVGVAAHEAGHALQYAKGYSPIKLRTAILPVCSIGSNLAFPLVLIGFMTGILILAELGIIFFGLATLFQLITLPVEYNASARATAALEASNYLSDEDLNASKKVLSAAALTYVAALAVSLANFLRLISIVNRRR